MPVNLCGNWKIDSSEGSKEIMLKMGIAPEKVDEMLTKEYVLCFKQDGDKFDISVTGDLKLPDTRFTVGQVFEHTGMDGVKRPTLANWEGDALVYRPGPGEPEEGFTREELVNGQLVISGEFKGIKYRNVYNKV